MTYKVCLFAIVFLVSQQCVESKVLSPWQFVQIPAEMVTALWGFGEKKCPLSEFPFFGHVTL